MFKTEKELVESFCIIYKEFYKEVTHSSIRNIFLIKEFNSNFGVADIVIGNFQRNKKAESLIPLKEDWLHPLINLKVGQTFHISDAQLLFGLSKESFKKRIEIYYLNGYLEINEDGSFKVIKEYDLLTSNVISIEAKLKDWKRALAQANRYKRFSKYSFVLIDEANSSAAIKHIASFQELNIGLVSFDGQSVRILHTPYPNQKMVKEYTYRLNEVAFHHALLQGIE